jgi:hypothetical protein
MTRFQYDSSLIAVFLDRWQPETQSFHLLVVKMTTSLKDVAILFGLLLGGVAMGAIDVHNTWRLDFLARFTNVPRNDRVPQPYQPFKDAHEPTMTWLQQFSVRAST